MADVSHSSGASTVPKGVPTIPELGTTGTPVINTSPGTLYPVGETLESGNVVFPSACLESGNRAGVVAGEQEGLCCFRLEGRTIAIPWVDRRLRRHFFSPSWNLERHPYRADGAFWMSGSGLAADSSGNVYAITANGSWDGTSNFSNRFVKLSPNLTLLDYFTPFNQAALSVIDLDVGSGGVLLVPDQSGAFPHEAIGCGKSLAIYVVDRDNMGKIQTDSNSQIIQQVDNQFGGGAARNQLLIVL